MFKSWSACTSGDVATIGCLTVVFLNVVNAVLAFAGAYALYLFIVGGYKFISSNGDSKRLESARANLIYGTLGLVMIFSAYTIIRIISDVTGVKCILKFGFGCQ